MATIINTQPTPQKEDESASITPLIIILLLVVLIIFIYYFFGTLKSGFSAPNVQVPSKIDVNINKK